MDKLSHYLVLSDIHLGHNVNKTINIKNNLIKYLNDYEEVLQGLQVLFIAGDTFDNIIPTSHPDFKDAMDTLIYIIRWCADRKCKLRILEGTRSHDWKQVEVIYRLMKELRLEADLDFKYIDRLMVEVLLDTTILYIPDNLNETAELTQKEIEQYLISKKLKTVDVVIMHGQFHYQIPITLKSSHNEAYYHSITNKYIHVGHIHTHSVNNRIIAQGSFDRLAHGEEEDKGGVLVKDDTWMFLKNEYAMQFKTYDFRNMEDSEVIRELKMILTTLKEKMCLRFIVTDRNSFIKLNDSIPLILKEHNVKVIVKPDSKNIVAKKTTNTLPELNKKNIHAIVHNELRARVATGEVDGSYYNSVIAILDDVVKRLDEQEKKK